MNDTIGIDISKTTPDAFRRSTGEHRQFANDANGCKALIHWIRMAHAETTRVVFESWRRHYNTICLHESLGYRPPVPEVFVPALVAWPSPQTRIAATGTLPLAQRPVMH